MSLLLKNPGLAVLGLAAFAIMGVGTGYAGPIVDNFADSSQLTVWGADSMSVGNNTLTVTRVTANVDGGVDWFPTSLKNTYFSLAPADGQYEFKMDVASIVNGAYYTVQAQLFNSSGSYINAVALQSDTNVTGWQIYDVAALSSAFPTATQYNVRIRINPWGATNSPAHECPVISATIPVG